MASSSLCCCRFSSPHFPLSKRSGGGLLLSRSFSNVRALVVRASAAVDSSESSSDFARRMEQAWAISKQPRPVACSSCESNGYIECKWCGGTGFFIIGNNMLCEVPSRNTSCIICAGKTYYPLPSCQRCIWTRDCGWSLCIILIKCAKKKTKIIVICKGSACCPDCKGTGFRAKWLGKPHATS